MTHPLSMEPNDDWKIDGRRRNTAEPDEPGEVRTFSGPCDVEKLKDRLWCQSPGHFIPRRAHINNGGTRHDYDYSKET